MVLREVLVGRRNAARRLARRGRRGDEARRHRCWDRGHDASRSEDEVGGVVGINRRPTPTTGQCQVTLLAGRYASFYANTSKRMIPLLKSFVCPGVSRVWVARDEWRELEVYNGPENLRLPRRQRPREVVIQYSTPSDPCVSCVESGGGRGYGEGGSGCNPPPHPLPLPVLDSRVRALGRVVISCLGVWTIACHTHPISLRPRSIMRGE